MGPYRLSAFDQIGDLVYGMAVNSLASPMWQLRCLSVCPVQQVSAGPGWHDAHAVFSSSIQQELLARGWVPPPMQERLPACRPPLSRCPCVPGFFRCHSLGLLPHPPSHLPPL